MASGVCRRARRSSGGYELHLCSQRRLTRGSATPGLKPHLDSNTAGISPSAKAAPIGGTPSPWLWLQTRKRVVVALSGTCMHGRRTAPISRLRASTAILDDPPRHGSGGKAPRETDLQRLSCHSRRPFAPVLLATGGYLVQRTFQVVPAFARARGDVASALGACTAELRSTMPQLPPPPSGPALQFKGRMDYPETEPLDHWGLTPEQQVPSLSFPCHQGPQTCGHVRMRGCVERRPAAC